MITPQNWKVLVKKQAELDQLIVQKSPVDLKWVSHCNAARLKLALLVEVGEFANEIKSFKAWRKKPEIDWAKAREELIDCLGYFLGLDGIYKINMSPVLIDKNKEKGASFNELLLDFFAKTNALYIEKNEQFYTLEDSEIPENKKNTYYDWLRVFNQISEKLQIDEQKLLNIYLAKNEINLQRAQAK
ncbi:MAG: dUTP diphosphatase [Mycoplasmataceae bacterium RV_VA103A]|nr:MAG: dUTP diphosphatase [Mycoplasmataceae bacterium RV_VA103A]